MGSKSRPSEVQLLEELTARDEVAPIDRIVIDFEECDHLTWVRFSQFSELPEGQAEQVQAPALT